MKKIKITLVKSTIGSLKRHKRTVEALGLHRINQSVTHKLTPSIEGMIKHIRHLIQTEQ